MPDLTKIRMFLGNDALRGGPFVRCFIFGSFLLKRHPNDVDVLLVSSKWVVKEQVRGLRKRFLEEFHVPLHVQLFHISDVSQINKFIEKAGVVEEV